MEGYALHTAAGQANRSRGDLSWWQYIHRARAPELPVILLEDAGAVTGLLVGLVGVGLTVITGSGVFDAGATVAIGVLLVAIAVLLGPSHHLTAVDSGPRRHAPGPQGPPS